MRALVIDSPGNHAVRTVPDPAPGRAEVVVRPRAVGICGTDIHILAGEFPPAPYPLVPGHEFAGEIVALGPRTGDSPLREGDRVAVDPSLFCGSCHYCAIGRGNLCERWGAIGDTVDGAMAEYVAAPIANCHRMPDGMSWAAGALVEPLSCAVHALDVLPPLLGAHCLVYGAGTMGLLMVQVVASTGAASISVVDVNVDRLTAARTLGATATAADAAEFDRACGWEVVIDCSGAQAAIEDGLRRVRRGGVYQQFGVAPAAVEASISPFRIYNDEITIVGSMAVLNSFGRAIDIMAAGVVDTDVMVTHSFGLDQYDDALRTFSDGIGRKIQIRP